MSSILIVGAGPTGLTLAAVLARHGVAVRIIDKATVPPEDRSRAIVIQARTMEIFRDLGVDQDILDAALIVENANLFLPSGKHGTIRFESDWIESRFNRITSLPQDETERILGALLTRAGVQVERGVTLEGIEQTADRVRCTVSHADGRQEEIRADWIVGADGAHSAVRHLAGLSFEGETYSDEALLGDVDIEWGLPEGQISACPSATGFLLAFPLPGAHRFRIIVIRPASAPSDQRSLSESEFLGHMTAMLPPSLRSPLRLLKTRWLTRYRLHRRGVAQYRAGRAFVAGDAAHIHSPVGAQGMNTGIQDAYNLGWKLAQVAKGLAPDSILESYHEERFPVGQHLLKGTDAAFALLARGGTMGRLLRTLMPGLGIRLISRGAIGRRVARLISQTTIRYRHSSIVSESADAALLGPTAPSAGDRMPDVRMDDGVWLHDLLQGARYTLLCFDMMPSSSLAARVSDVVRDSSPDVRIVHLEATGSLHRFASGTGGMYLVRPDKHIGFRGSANDVDALARALDMQFVKATATQ